MRSISDAASQSSEGWRVHKFGGTSMGSPEAIKEVADIITYEVVAHSSK